MLSADTFSGHCNFEIATISESAVIDSLHAIAGDANQLTSRKHIATPMYVQTRNPWPKLEWAVTGAYAGVPL